MFSDKESPQQDSLTPEPLRKRQKGFDDCKELAQQVNSSRPAGEIESFVRPVRTAVRSSEPEQNRWRPENGLQLGGYRQAPAGMQIPQRRPESPSASPIERCQHFRWR